MIINRANLTAATTGFKTIFNNAFASAASDYAKVAMVVPSATKQEVYAWLGTTTRFREWIGARVVQNLSTHDFTIKNRPFENTIAVNRDDIEDDTIGVYTPLFQGLGNDAKTHPDELVFSLLKAGTSTTCYDGQPFFATNHPVINEKGKTTSVANFQDGASPAWYLLDTSKPVKPLIFQKRREYNFVSKTQLTDDNVFDLNEFVYGADARVNAGVGLWQLAYASKAELTTDNLSAAIAAMMEVKGDNGRPLNVKSTLLVAPPSLRTKALTLIKAETIEATTNINRDVVEVLVSPWLA